MQAYTMQVGETVTDERDCAFAEGTRFARPERRPRPMEKAIHDAREAGDSLGGVVEIRATGVPAGLGDPVMDKLDASLAWGLMSIGAVKGSEIGDGYAAAKLAGRR